MKKIIAIAILAILISCHAKQVGNKMGTVERIDPALDSLISPGAVPEVIAERFAWSEGPVWVDSIHALLFSDVPKNIIYKWTAEKGCEMYLTPSGYTSDVKRGGEMGSNGLLLNNEGKLVLCQDGNRQMAWMNAPLGHPAANFVKIASHYQGKRFSSPNDAVYNSEGELFFTDPPYGLETQRDDDPAKEIPYNGVFKVKKNGDVVLLIDSLARPNGIAFLPGQKKLLIANSDGAKPNWYVYDVNGDSLTNGKIFCSTVGSPKQIKDRQTV
ncbi:MAG: SMP-30/gluconolactonase/LRE family protein [Ferruginibacter sp.]